MNMYFKTKRNDFIRWYKYNTETRDERAAFAASAFAYAFLLIIVLAMFIVMWKIFLFILAFIAVLGVIFSPIIIWIMKGEKR